MLNTKKLIKDSRGNALFLILIAVALFAALSYAVTQSGRGGSGIDREQAAITAAEMTQYMAGLRTAVMRMTITGIDETELEFATTAGVDDEVFDAAGGGAIEQDPPGNAGASAAYVYLNAQHATDGWYVTGIGSDTVTSGRDVMAVATDIAQGVCQEINRGLGLATTPLQEATAVVTGTAFTGAGAANNAGTFNSHNAAPQPYACVDNDPTAAVDYTYYHVLAEQ